jgi:hypothetical protein
VRQKIAKTQQVSDDEYGESREEHPMSLFKTMVFHSIRVFEVESEQKRSGCEDKLKVPDSNWATFNCS